MKTFLGLALSAGLLLLSQSAQAGFVYTDWQVAGDKKALLHEETGLEWLRLTHTHGESINSVMEKLSTTYAGWRFPTNAEVEIMARAINPTTNLNRTSITPEGDRRLLVNRTWATRFIDWFGNGNKSASTHLGLYVDEDGIVRRLGAYANEGGGYVWIAGLEDSTVYNRDSRLTSSRTGGIFLVSDGGTTLSSILTPSLNINNPNAPINNPIPEPTPEGGDGGAITPPNDVPSAPMFLSALLLGFLIKRRSKK